ncbi:MAG: hypothetical protein H6873_05150 [Hyphomicrobiaceae bacterium]|nr:hypothetical protein [Hyphomicrobiaceae bacterium]
MRQDFAGFFPLRNRRAHEVTGPGAVAFALALAAGMEGPVMWIVHQRQAERLHPGGVGRFIDPSRLIVSRGTSDLDLLWIAEEALRSGAVPLVVAQLGGDVDLTAGRRLQLAAEAGRALGLFILPEGLGSNAAETRWHCAPVMAPPEHLDSTLFEWVCIKNKSGTNGSWTTRWNDAAHHIDCLSETGDRSLPAAASARAG